MIDFNHQRKLPQLRYVHIMNEICLHMCAFVGSSLVGMRTLSLLSHNPNSSTVSGLSFSSLAALTHSTAWWPYISLHPDPASQLTSNTPPQGRRRSMSPTCIGCVPRFYLQPVLDRAVRLYFQALPPPRSGACLLCAALLHDVMLHPALRWVIPRTSCCCLCAGSVCPAPSAGARMGRGGAP